VPPKLSLQPANRIFGFQWIGPVALEALECALSLTTGREREFHLRLAIRAGWAISFRHGLSSIVGCSDGRLFILVKHQVKKERNRQKTVQ
jgi:hypothetical protein